MGDLVGAAGKILPGGVAGAAIGYAYFGTAHEGTVGAIVGAMASFSLWAVREYFF